MRMSITPMVKNLLIINIGVFIACLLLQSFDLQGILALRYVFSSEFIPSQLITYMFAHADFWHLFGNMISLFFFGPLLEQVWGAKKFLFFYVFCGLGAAFLYSGIHSYELSKLAESKDRFMNEPSIEYLLSFERQFGSSGFNADFKEKFEDNPENKDIIEQAVSGVSELFDRAMNGRMLGASGAVFGILMAFALLFPNMEMMLLFPPIPIKAKYFVLIYVLLELYLGVRPIPGDHIAHFAHLGGALFGLILVQYWKRK